MKTDYMLQQDEEADKELQAMYGEQAETEEPDLTPDEETPTEESASEEAEETADIEELKAQIADLQAKYKASLAGMGAAQREAAELRKMQQQENPGTPESSNPSGDEELEMAREDFPDIVNPITRLIDALSKKVDELESKHNALSGEHGKLENMIHGKSYWDEIKQSFPDVAKIAESPEYADWYAQQPDDIKSLLHSTNPQDVVKALDLFKSESKPKVEIAIAVGENKPAGESKLEQAKKTAAPSISSMANPKTAPKFTFEQINRMSNAEYLKNEKAIDEAMARGEVQ